MIVLLADAREILQYVAAPHPDIIAIVESFKVPTTVIYENGLDFPANVLGQDGSVAIRVTTDAFCKALIKRLRRPIVSTSANISGAPTPAIFKMVATEIIHNVDYAVQYRQDDEKPSVPSRIVKIDQEGNLMTLR